VPTFSPAPGTEFTSSLDIEISCSTEDVTVYYTIDATDPTESSESSTPYTDPITIDETTTFKAKAFMEGWTASAVATAIYTKTGTVAAPTFDPGPGSYSTAQTVTISCDTDDTTIYYTTNGSNPTDGSSPYTEPVTISATTTLKARAFKAGMEPSDIVSGLYTIEESWSDNAYYTNQGWEFNSLDIDPDTPGWQLPTCNDAGKEVAISPGSRSTTGAG
jgi:chitinase